MLNTPERAKNLANSLLDAGYTQATDQLIRALTRTTNDGIIAQRLNEFQAEAQRLAEEGQPMTSDNAVFRALMADMRDVLKRQGGMVDAAAGDVQQNGTNAGMILARQLTLPGFSDAQLTQIGIAWNQPNPEVIAQVVNFINKDAWRNQIGSFGDDIWQVIQNHTLAGIALGKGPLTIARELRNLTETLPLYQANNLLRTLQLTSYRNSTAATYVANSDILVGQMRIATLDDRTCMACVTQHGTMLEIGETVEDHHQGRCTSIGILRGREYDVQSGADWFNDLDEERQRSMMGDSSFEAWQTGAINLQDFVQKYKDPVFGEMVREASLKGMLGNSAQRYYESAAD